MAIFGVVFFIFTVIALGMVGLKKLFTFRRKPKVVIRQVNPATDEAYVDEKYKILMMALKNEGYFNERRSEDDAMVLVDSTYLAALIQELDKDTDLNWSAPRLRLRLRPVPDQADAPFKQKYNWILMTPSHSIGFQRAPKE